MAALPPISKFPQVDQADASGELAKIYDDIRSTLRMPWVPFAIRVMSQFPAFVPAAWQALKPQISTLYAEKGADLVREASIIPGPTPPDPRPKLRAAGRSDEEISKIHKALDSLNYGNPKGLILITAWNEAWNERAAGNPANSLSTAEARQLPYGLPDGVEKLRLVDPDLALDKTPISPRKVVAEYAKFA
jgi:Halocarboxylic acid dehydrogenase DehI